MHIHGTPTTSVRQTVSNGQNHDVCVTDGLVSVLRRRNIFYFRENID
jgi:hypothetical protein